MSDGAFLEEVRRKGDDAPILGVYCWPEIRAVIEAIEAPGPELSRLAGIIRAKYALDKKAEGL